MNPLRLSLIIFVIVASLYSLMGADTRMRITPTTTTFTRQLLTNEDAVKFRAKLEIAVVGTNLFPFDTNWFVISNNTVSLSGYLLDSTISNINLTTTVTEDISPNIPTVPISPPHTNLWRRIPHPSDTTNQSRMYAYNPYATNHPMYGRWELQQPLFFQSVTNQNPNGYLEAGAPAISYDRVSNVWIQTKRGPTNQGWSQLITTSTNGTAIGAYETELTKLLKRQSTPMAWREQLGLNAQMGYDTNNIFIAYRTDGNPGDGSSGNPYDGSSDVKLTTLFSNYFSPNKTIWLYDSLDYKVIPRDDSANYPYSIKNGMTLRSVSDNPWTCKISASTNMLPTSIQSNKMAVLEGAYTPYTNTVVRGIWINGNCDEFLSHFGWENVTMSMGAITLWGSRNRIENCVETGTWGVHRTGAENFGLACLGYGSQQTSPNIGGTNYGPLVSSDNLLGGNVIKDCVVICTNQWDSAWSYSDSMVVGGFSYLTETNWLWNEDPAICEGNLVIFPTNSYRWMADIPISGVPLAGNTLTINGTVHIWGTQIPIGADAAACAVNLGNYFWTNAAAPHYYTNRLYPSQPWIHSPVAVVGATVTVNGTYRDYIGGTTMSVSSSGGWMGSVTVRRVTASISAGGVAFGGNLQVRNNKMFFGQLCYSDTWNASKTLVEGNFCYTPFNAMFLTTTTNVFSVADGKFERQAELVIRNNHFISFSNRFSSASSADGIITFYHPYVGAGYGNVGPTNLTITGNKFVFENSGSQTGIFLQTAKNVRVEGNEFNGTMSGSRANGITFVGACTNISIKNNTFNDIGFAICQQHGGGGKPRQVSIIGNQSRNTFYWFASIIADDMIITGNNVSRYCAGLTNDPYQYAAICISPEQYQAPTNGGKNIIIKDNIFSSGGLLDVYGNPHPFYSLYIGGATNASSANKYVNGNTNVVIENNLSDSANGDIIWSRGNVGMTYKDHTSVGTGLWRTTGAGAPDAGHRGAGGNIMNITNTATAVFSVTFNQAMRNVNYASNLNIYATAGRYGLNPNLTNITTTGFGVVLYNDSTGAVGSSNPDYLRILMDGLSDAPQ